MRKLIFLLTTIILVVGIGIAIYAQTDPAVTTVEAPGEDLDANFADMTSGENGSADGKAIQESAFRNKNQLLIDFTKFQEYVELSADKGYYVKDDTLRNPATVINPDDPAHVERTGDPSLIDTFGEEGNLEPLYKVTVRDMRYQNWLVELNSSADKVQNRRGSYCKEVARKNGEKVLGVRVCFPDTPFNAWAKVRPPFSIRAYTTNNLKAYSPRFKDIGGQAPQGYTENDHAGYGIIDNVGQIKQLTLEAYGLNQNVGVAVVLNDQYDNETEYFMGYLNFPGWRRLIWNNPNYITSVDHRDIFKVPLYPVERPLIRFESVKLYRQGTEKVVNFVTYFRNVKISYDFAVPPEAERDIDDEFHWQLLRKKYAERTKMEERQAREVLYLRRQERARLGANEKPKDFVNPNSKW